MNSEDANREPITPRVLLRYKVLICVVATLVILGGYARIITQPRRHTATVRLKSRFSGGEFLLQDLGNVKVPLLEEEVKSYVAQILDRTFIDKVVQALPQRQAPPSLPGEDAEPPIQNFFENAQGAYLTARKAVFGFFDTILQVEDTVVSERERRAASILGGLTVLAGEEASHIITIQYAHNNAQRSADVVNTIALQFIELQKQKVKKRDVAKLEAEVVRAKNDMIDIKRRLTELAKKVGYSDLDVGIQMRFEEIRAMKKEREAIKSALPLLSEKIMPKATDLPIERDRRSSDENRQHFTALIGVWRQQVQSPESAKVTKELEERITAYIEGRKAQEIAELKIELTRKKELLDRDITMKEEDNRLFEHAAVHAALVVEQNAATARFARSEEERLLAHKFNNALDNESVAEHVTISQIAAVPAYPDPQRRGLKFMVVIVLGFVAGSAVALGRHMLWPKPAAGTYGVSPAAGEVNVPIIVLPEQGDEAVESDLEFDMTFPKDKPEKQSEE